MKERHPITQTVIHQRKQPDVAELIDLHKPRPGKKGTSQCLIFEISPLTTQRMTREVHKGAFDEGTNLWAFENLIFPRPLLKEDFVLAVPRPCQERLHKVLVVFKRPF